MCSKWHGAGALESMGFSPGRRSILTPLSGRPG